MPNTPHHVVQRGHNRQTVFVGEDDFDYYRENLIFFKQEFNCKIFAYCLMTNHVHLIIDPGDNPEMLSQLMKRVAGRQTRYVNKLEKRTGSLWEGRFKSSIVSTAEYLPACCRYIELNPVRASVAINPADYKWSSFNCLANGKIDPVVDQRPCYKSLGTNGPERQKAWKTYVYDTIADYELKLIRDALQRGQVTGGDKFQQEISKKLGIRLSNKGPGRPKKVKN
ncbi:MAG: transposase [Desulforhopalus sp.]